MITCYRTDRRRCQRVHVTLGVVYRVLGPRFVSDFMGSDEYESQTLNISECGTAILSENYLPVGTSLYLKFVVFESDHVGAVRFFEPLTVVGEVRSSFIQKDYRYRLGLSFEHVPEDRKSILLDLVKSSLRTSKEFSCLRK